MPTHRSAQKAICATVGAWLAGLSIERADGSTYTFPAVLAQLPDPAEKMTYPKAVLIAALDYDNCEPHEQRNSRTPATGTGVYLEKTGELAGQLTILLFGKDDDQEDELVGAVEQALVPGGAEVPRVLLTATDYYDQVVTLRRQGFRPATHVGTMGMAVWRPSFICGVSCDVVRERVAEDFQPQVDATVDDVTEILVDIVTETTTEPTDE